MDRLGDRGHHRHQRYFADPLHALRMLRVRHFDHYRVEHRQGRTNRHAIVEEAGVIDLAVLVVDVFLVQRPADPLRNAALHLALDIARMDGAADVLHRGVADDAHDPEFGIDLDVADVGTETTFRAFGVELHAGADRPAHLRGFCRKLGQRQRFELTGFGAVRILRAVFTFHLTGAVIHYIVSTLTS